MKEEKEESEVVQCNTSTPHKGTLTCVLLANAHESITYKTSSHTSRMQEQVKKDFLVNGASNFAHCGGIFNAHMHPSHTHTHTHLIVASDCTAHKALAQHVHVFQQS